MVKAQKQVSFGRCTVEEQKTIDEIIEAIKYQTGNCTGLKDAFMRLGHACLNRKVNW